MILEEAYFIS